MGIRGEFSLTTIVLMFMAWTEGLAPTVPDLCNTVWLQNPIWNICLWHVLVRWVNKWEMAYVPIKRTSITKVSETEWIIIYQQLSGATEVQQRHMTALLNLLISLRTPELSGSLFVYKVNTILHQVFNLSACTITLATADQHCLIMDIQ